MFSSNKILLKMSYILVTINILECKYLLDPSLFTRFEFNGEIYKIQQFFALFIYTLFFFLKKLNEKLFMQFCGSSQT